MHLLSSTDFAKKCGKLYLVFSTEKLLGLRPLAVLAAGAIFTQPYGRAKETCLRHYTYYILRQNLFYSLCIPTILEYSKPVSDLPSNTIFNGWWIKSFASLMLLQN